MRFQIPPTCIVRQKEPRWSQEESNSTPALRARKGCLLLRDGVKQTKPRIAGSQISLAKHSFVDLCSLIERAPLSLIGPGAIIRGVFRHPHAEDSSLPF